MWLASYLLASVASFACSASSERESAAITTLTARLPRSMPGTFEASRRNSRGTLPSRESWDRAKGFPL
ncbi:hypothetical protein D3C87_1967460 [compost metagenome]